MIKFEVTGYDQTGDPLYDLIVDGQLVQQRLTMDEVLLAISIVDEQGDDQ